MRKLEWPLLCSPQEPQPPVFIPLTKVPVALEASQCHEDMVHPFFKHLCAVFLSALCFVSILKLHGKTRDDPSMAIADGNYSDDYFEIEEDGQPAQLHLNNLRSFGVPGRNESIFFLGLFELNTKTGKRKESDGEVSAAQLAVEHVNKLEVLPGYSVRLLINDTKVRHPV